jgi:hypothetical protein
MRKILSFSALAVTLFLSSCTGMSSAQETKEKVKLVQDTVDEFTKQVVKITKPYYSGKPRKKVKFFISRYGETYGLCIAPVVNLGCCGAGENYVTFLFNDDTTLTLDVDRAIVDCAGGQYSVYEIDESMFQGKTIKKIRLMQSVSFLDADYTCEYSMQELIGAVK